MCWQRMRTYGASNHKPPIHESTTTIWLPCVRSINPSSVGTIELVGTVKLNTLKADEDVAVILAGSEALSLTDAHWEIILILRSFYAATEVSPAMRPFVKLVREQLGTDKGNSIYLMELFGSSPAKMAAKVAGLPRPTNCL